MFDEASQVTLEEAIPAIFRGKQVVVVGDERHMKDMGTVHTS
jgi:superfamily I DNA and/or RNA helicase